jgi:antitoxin StbD
MNAGFQRVEADLAVSITELKKNPSAVFKAAELQQVAVLNHNKVAGYIISAAAWEHLLEMIEDLEDIAEIEKRRGEEAIPVSLDAL